MLARRDQVAWRAMIGTLALLPLRAGGDGRTRLPRVRHRPGRQRRALPGAEEHTHGLLIGTLTTLVMLPFAVVLGLLAGYFGGWVDDVIQYLYTTLNSIPGVLLIAAAVLMMQVYIDTHPDGSRPRRARRLRLLALCLILGVTSWTGLCRLPARRGAQAARTRFHQAARAFGVSNCASWRATSCPT
jgi:ABC-type dipeptide/oligopeptide/nickel transport system permease subunit